MGLNEQAGLDSRQGWMGEKLDQVNIVFNFFYSPELICLSMMPSWIVSHL